MTTSLVTVRINGESLLLRSDQSLAAALLNSGIVNFRTSVKGSTRGPLCGMGSCYECRVTIDGAPHRRACLEPVVDGMEVVTGE